MLCCVHRLCENFANANINVDATRLEISYASVTTVTCSILVMDAAVEDVIEHQDEAIVNSSQYITARRPI